MGTLNVTTIAGVSGGSTDCNVQGEGSETTNLAQGLAKARAQHAAGTLQSGSLNHSSITDNGTL